MPRYHATFSFLFGDIALIHSSCHLFSIHQSAIFPMFGQTARKPQFCARLFAIDLIFGLCVCMCVCVRALILSDHRYAIMGPSSYSAGSHSLRFVDA
jgi:hypothetical protein